MVLPVPPSIAGWLAVNSLAGGVVLVGIWPAAITKVMCEISARMNEEELNCDDMHMHMHR